MTDQSIKVFRKVPVKLRHTLTVDNGKEFADFKTMEKKTGLSIYFADPYTPGQRATNENTNGLVRQYCPKGSDFSIITEQRLAQVVKQLNHRPRKYLGYRTPHEVFNAAKRGAL